MEAGMRKRFELKDWHIHGECSAGLIDEFFVGGGSGGTRKMDDSLDVVTPHGPIKTRTPSSADAVRALNKERQMWQDAALSGGLPERLPRTIDAGALARCTNDGEKRADALAIIEGGPKERTGPDYGGKYAAISMSGWCEAFDGIIVPTFLDVRNFHDVDWYVMTDDAETWAQVEAHCTLPMGSLNEPDFGLEVQAYMSLLMGVVSPQLLIGDAQLNVELHNQRPILGSCRGECSGKRLSGWIEEGEIVIPLMPVDIEQWRKVRVETGAVSEALSGQLDADNFAMDPEDFLNLVCEHQKACNRFAHALWAVNFVKEA